MQIITDKLRTLIREQDPLKQGLKLCSRDRVVYRTLAIREQDPLKQGLKLTKLIKKSLHSIIREQDPLKQGLKPFRDFYMLDLKLFVSKIH